MSNNLQTAPALLTETWFEGECMYKELGEILESLKTDPFWVELCQAEVLSEMVVTVNGLVLYPLTDPFLVLAQFKDVIFTRQLQPGGLYEWVTTYNKFQVIIVANEHIDLTGTAVTENKKEQTTPTD